MTLAASVEVAPRCGPALQLWRRCRAREEVRRTIAPDLIQRPTQAHERLGVQALDVAG